MSVSPRVCHRRPTVLWQRAKPVIVGWFAGRTCKITSGIPDGLYYLVTFMVGLYHIHKCGCGPHSTTGRPAAWRPELSTVQRRNCMTKWKGYGRKTS